jgi:hypothetical protein
MDDVTFFKVEWKNQPYLVSREKPPVGRPKTRVFSEKGEVSKRTVRLIREAIEKSNGA